MNRDVVLMGYSGHAYVVADVLLRMGRKPHFYCEKNRKEENLFELEYLGYEQNSDVIQQLKKYDYALAVGNNNRRAAIFETVRNIHAPINVICPSSVFSEFADLGSGIMIGSGVSVQAFAQIGDGVICNTGSVIEHECKVGKFSHIAPSAVLLGGVEVGDYSLIGANSVIKQGTKLGERVVVGAGAVVLNDISDGTTVVGNPAKPLTKNKIQKLNDAK